MTWQNLFDASACTVAVTNGTTTLWIGTLGKGQSSPVFDGLGGGAEPMQVVIDGSGVVTLSWQTGATVQSTGYEVDVNPAHPLVLSPGRRARALSGYIASADQAGMNANVSASASVPLSFSGSTPGVLALTPDPADMSTLAGAVRIGIAQGTPPPPMLAGRWLATNTSDWSEVWYSDDPISWPNAPVTLSSPGSIGAFGGGYTGGVLALEGGAGGSANADALIIPNQPLANNPFTSSYVNTGKPGLTMAAIGGILFRCLENNLPSYTYSTDGGTTWTPINLPGSLYMHAIARLNSGRWIALLANGATQTIQYSDQAIPTSWTDTGVSIAGTYVDILACDGVTALVPNNVGGIYKSIDGASWTYHAGAFPVSYSGTQKVGRAIGSNTFLFQGVSNTGAFYVSTDAGSTWNAHTRVSGESNGALQNIGVHGNTVTLSWTQGVTSDCSIDVSHDLGVTWASSTLPWASPRTKIPVCLYLG